MKKWTTASWEVFSYISMSWILGDPTEPMYVSDLNFSILLLLVIKAVELLFSSPFLVCQSCQELRNLLILIDLICAIFNLMLKTSVVFSWFGSGGMECLQHFLLEYASFSPRYICMDWSCSFVFLFRPNQVFSIFTTGGILVCSINVPILFSYRIF